MYPGAPEACNGLDDSCTGLVDDNWDCWVTHYRFVSAQGTYCWGDDVTPPPACAGYTLDREAWVAATEPVPGTYELVQCSSFADPVVHDHILVERGDPDYNALLGIYDCSLSLGYLFRDGQAPAAGSTWFANSCDVWRYSHDAGHLFTAGVDDVGAMTCEKEVGVAMSDQSCHIAANGGC